MTKQGKHDQEVKAGKHPDDEKRSNQWPKVRKAWLTDHPLCAVCNSKIKVEVHHKQPFHLDRSKELDPTNFITLCESEKYVNCHLTFGHLGNFKSFNKDVESDTNVWNKKIKERP